jgi:hypothetical protein
MPSVVFGPGAHSDLPPGPATISTAKSAPVGLAMSPVSVLRTRAVDSNASDRETHKQDEPGCQPIDLLSFLEAENMRLRQAVAELSLDTMALREALKRWRIQLCHE